MNFINNKFPSINELKVLVSDTIFYTGLSILTQCLSIISFSLLTNNFSIANYGVINSLFILTQFFITLIIFGQDQALARYLHYYKTNSEKKGLISETLCYQLLIYFFIVLPLIIIFRNNIKIISDYDYINSLVNIILLQIPFSIIVSFSLNLFKWSFSRFKFFVVLLSGSILHIFSLSIGIKFFSISVEGVFIIILFNNIVIAVMSMLLMKNMLSFSFRFFNSRKLLSYAIPYGILCSIYCLVPLLQRGIILYRFNLYELGLFSAAYSLALLFESLGFAFQSAWQPNAFVLYDKKKSQFLFKFITKLFSIIMCVLILFFCGISDLLITHIASEKYKLSIIFIFPLAIAFSINHLSFIIGIGMKISEKSKFELYSYLIYLFSTIIGIWYFSGKFDIYGICLGILFGQIIKLFFMSYFANTVYPFNWPFYSIAYVYILTLIIGFINLLLYYKTDFSISLLYIIGGFFVFIFGWLLLLTDAERNNILILLLDIKNKIIPNNE